MRTPTSTVTTTDWREFTDRDALQDLIATGLAADLHSDDPTAW